MSSNFPSGGEEGHSAAVGRASAAMQKSLSATEADHLMSVHHRKMLRRAANRRSAQLSRARKKVTFSPLP
jgi:hypothetical protein